MKPGRDSGLKSILRLLPVFALALSLISITGCSGREEPGTASVDELNLPGDLSDFLMADFDGDSHMEILALCKDLIAPEPFRKG